MKTALLRRDADGAAALAARCNEHTLRFGLALTETDALRLLAARFSDGAGLAGRQERAYLSACAAELAARTFALRETSALYGVFAAVSV